MTKFHEAAYAGYVYEKPAVGWTPEQEVKGRLCAVDLTSADAIPAGGPPILCDGKTAYIDTGDAHNAVCAISGMKKTICFFIPLIYFLGRAGENMAINDPKGELYERTAGYLKRRGYRVLCLDFRSMNRDGYNILDYPARLYRSGERDEGMALLNDIVSTLASPQMSNPKIDTFWPITASSYGLGTGGIMFESFPRLEQINLSNWDRFNTEEGFETLSHLIRHIPGDDMALLNLSAILSEPDKTLRSTVSTAHSFLAPFVQNNKLARMLSHSTFQLKDLCGEKTALYLITDDTSTTYSTVIGIILSQIRSFLVSTACRRSGGRLPVRFNFVLDETCSIPFPNLEQGLATDRSRGVRYHLCIQSLAGLKLRYPEYEALLANCGNLFFLGSTEAAMLERVSMQLGKTNITPDGREKPLVSTAELMTLKKTWEYKEGIYMNLSESIRFCTELPSMEAYPLGDRKAPVQTMQHPRVFVYKPQDLIDDVISERAPVPFVRQEDDDAQKNATDAEAELEKQSSDPFGSTGFHN